jgi:hypothetical protein
MSLPDALKDCTTYPGATEAEIEAAERALGRPLPDDYKEMLRATNGAEGLVSSGAYVALWSAAEIAPLNEGYAVDRFAPGLTLLGTDGGGEGYGFVVKDEAVEYVNVPLVGMDLKTITTMGRALDEFLRRLPGLG